MRTSGITIFSKASSARPASGYAVPVVEGNGAGHQQDVMDLVDHEGLYAITAEQRSYTPTGPLPTINTSVVSGSALLLAFISGTSAVGRAIGVNAMYIKNE
ncbi:hypothetical protein P4234_16890 [Pseudomonas aeruginosa]|nr:hypothetical protein [Pseudomonas aeruginosa]